MGYKVSLEGDFDNYEGANDVEQTNDNESGFAIATPNPELSQGRQFFGKPGEKVYLPGTEQDNDTLNIPDQLEGQNVVRFVAFGVAVNNVNAKQALPDNRYREYLCIQNQSANDVFIGFGTSPGINGENGFRVSAGGFYELDNKVPYSSITVIGTIAASQIVLFIDGTKELTVR